VNKMIKDVSDVARSVMNIRSVNPINQAQAPISPSGPNRLLYIAVAFLVGLFVAIVIVVVADMLNTRVRGPKDLEELIDVPVIGRIPTIEGGR
jgi:capsular polysaccharide biosynthesis protein